MQQELARKEIRGLTIRQLLPVIAFLTGACSLYFGLKAEMTSIRDQQMQIKDIMIDVKTEQKDDQRMNDDRMKVIEQAQRQLDIRMTIIETQLKDHSK